MSRIILCFCVCLLFLLSCKDDNYGWKLSHSEILDISDKIIIRSQKKIIQEGGGYSFRPDNVVKIELNDKFKLSKFKNLFNSNKLTGYCCCPDANFVIQFYNSENNFVYYWVDTVESKTNVRIFHPGFQYSYLIDKNTWIHFLDDITK